MSKTKEKLSDFILQLLYHYERLYKMNFLTSTALLEYYEVKQIEKEKREKIQRQKKKIRDAIHYLKKAGYIEKNANENIKITPRGAINYISRLSRTYKKPKLKINKQYLIIFDIPERHRKIRDLLRKVLYNFGSEMLQKSVFIIYDKKAYEYIKELIKFSQIDKYVKFIQIKSLE